MTQLSNRPNFSLGELVSAAMEQARAVAPDERTAAKIASRTVARWLARSGRQDIAKRLRQR